MTTVVIPSEIHTNGSSKNYIELKNTKEELLLREYQLEDKLQIQQYWRQGYKNVMLQAPTASGKTPTAVKIADEHLTQYPDATVVVLTGSYEANDQFRYDFERFTNHTIFNGTATRWRNTQKIYFPKHNIITTSPQILWNRLKCNTGQYSLADYFDRNDLLIVDEAHHSVARTWERVIKSFPGYVLGMTATPWRMRKDVGFDHIYDILHCSWQTKKLIEKGYLAWVDWDSPGEDRRMKSEGARLAPNGDYLINDLLKFNPKSVRTYNAIDYWEKQAIQYNDHGQADIRKTIFYALSSDHAIELHTELTRRGYKGRVLLSRRDPSMTIQETKLHRKETVDMFRNGHIDYIVNVYIISEGFNCPDADCIVILRNTLSVALYLQMAGRGMRPSDKYDTALIIDMTASWMNIQTILDDRTWSLLPRSQTTEGVAPTKTCPSCLEECATNVHVCSYCDYAFGWECSGCKWRPRHLWYGAPSIIDVLKGAQRCIYCRNGVQMPLMYRFGRNEHLSNTLLYLSLEKNNDGWTARWHSTEHNRDFHVAYFHHDAQYWISLPTTDDWQNCCTVITRELSDNEIIELNNIGALANIKQWGFLTEAQKAIIEIEGLEHFVLDRQEIFEDLSQFIINENKFQDRWIQSARNPRIYLNSIHELGIKVWINQIEDELYKWGIYTNNTDLAGLVQQINLETKSYDNLDTMQRQIYTEITNLHLLLPYPNI